MLKNNLITLFQEIPSIGVAIGDLILDLKKTTGIFNGPLLTGNAHVFQKVPYLAQIYRHIH